MKVLVVSHNSFSKNFNNGKTLESIFSKFAKVDLMQLYFHDGENPDFLFVEKYFKITDHDIVKNLFNKQHHCGQLMSELNGSNLVRVKRTEIINNRFLRDLLLILRDFVWYLNKNKLNELKLWLNRERPDVIFYMAGDSVFPHKIVQEIAEEFNLPVCVYFTDDYIIYPKVNSLTRFIKKLLLKKAYQKTINLAKLHFAIGEKMSYEYSKFYNKEFYTIMNCIDIKPYTEFSLSNEIIVSYFGGLHLDRLQMILRLGRIFQKVNKCDLFKVVFTIYTSIRPNAKTQSLLEKSCILYGGEVHGKVLEEKMSSSTFLLHVESDNSYYKSLTKLSVSTKIPEYLNTSRPILAFGPIEVASMQLLLKLKLGITIDSQLRDEAIFDYLMGLFKDGSNLITVVKHGYKYATANFNKESVSLNLLNKINSLPNGGN